ncbi:MAG: 1-acyl-sn-glycerol-3-phosphate acyltransferase [Gammaproteobacteria bacterium]|nr:1-acyl-sn-glycerol-3-phosphate acyltransferase [Gammaproteobacteria bacterium]
MIYLRSIAFYIGEGLATIPFMFVSMAALPLRPRLRSRLIAGWAHFAVWWLRITCGVKLELTGTENIPQQPCVFACNHQSTWESIATQTFLPPLAWVLKKELLMIPFFGWGLWASRPIAIDRRDQRSARDQVIRQGLAKIAEGRHVLIFPEGTRTPYGKTGNYKRGAAVLAREAGVDIVPIAHDAGRYWSNTSWWIKPGTIRCIIGPAIERSANGVSKSDRELTDELKHWICSQNL